MGGERQSDAEYLNEAVRCQQGIGFARVGWVCAFLAA